MDNVTNYPLSWPFGWERTPGYKRKHSLFGKHSMLECVRNLEDEIRRARGRDMVVSTNVKVRLDGIPYSNQRIPDDSGAAVYFTWKGKPIVFACDKWNKVEENLWAIFKHIEALRGQERWGVGSLDQAFSGYAALPAPKATRPWWDVLEVWSGASEADIQAAYKRLAKVHHPDMGGDVNRFLEIQEAFDRSQA